MAIIYELAVASQFCSGHIQAVVADSFPLKNADWSGHVPTSRNQTRLEVFKMDLLDFILKISAYLSRVVSSSSKCEKENALQYSDFAKLFPVLKSQQTSAKLLLSAV